MKKYIPLLIITSLLLSACISEENKPTTVDTQQNTNNAENVLIDDECNVIWKKTGVIDCVSQENCVNEYAPVDKSKCSMNDTGGRDCPPPKQIWCRKLSDYEIKKEEWLKNICEKTGWAWWTSPWQPWPSKHCICEKTSERITYSDDEYKKYQSFEADWTIENFNERDGCISIKKSCELMWGTWEYNTRYKFYNICRVSEQIYQYFNGQWNKGTF